MGDSLSLQLYLNIIDRAHMMCVKGYPKNNLPAFFMATIENLFAYDALALGVSAGQILDFQLYAEDFEESLTDGGRRGEDTLQLIDTQQSPLLKAVLYLHYD